jgi:hypothetical protein
MPTVVGEVTRNAVFDYIVELGGLGTAAPTAKTLSSDRLAIDTNVAVYYVAAQSGVTDDIDGISGFNEGQFIIIRAAPFATLTLKDENAGAAAATDKIRLPGAVDVSFTDDEAVFLYHDDTLDRWVLLGGPGYTDAKAVSAVATADDYLKNNANDESSGTITAAGNLVYGDFCYMKSDGKMWKGDADAIATSSVIGMASATINAEASGSFLLWGFARDDTWTWTPGGLIYLSTTAGAPTQTAPSDTDDVIQILGVATHADRMLFKPELVQVEHTG